MSDLRNQAIALAKAGIKVFPIQVDAKVPATAHGFKDASCDLEQVEEWWQEDPDYNIGVCPADAGWSVIDLDPGGEDGWIDLLKKHGVHEPTYEVTTPREGRHIYFVGSIPSSAGKLGPHIDTRGEGGYVLVPPSVVNGRSYTITRDCELAALPSWIAPALGATTVAVKTAPPVELDTEANIWRARARIEWLLDKGDVAIAGLGGNDRTYKFFAELHNLGIGLEKALIMGEGWNNACVPPWEDDEFRVIAEHAYDYAQNGAGVWAVPTFAEAFGKTEAFREAMSAQPKKSRFGIENVDDMDTVIETKWLVEALIPAQEIVLWMGPTQSYKSFLALEIALSIAAGTPTFGSKTEPGLTLYGALEGKQGIGGKRRRAWQRAHNLTKEDVRNFHMMTFPRLGMPGDVDEAQDNIAEWLKGRPLKLLIIDTLGKTMSSLDENKSADARQFVELCESMRGRFGCAVLAVHHTGKDVSRGARGSSAFHADFDSVIEVSKVGDKLVEVWVRKHKDAEERETPWTFKASTMFGDSLVMVESAPDEHRDAKAEAEPFSTQKVARVLGAKLAHTAENGLSTAEVAIALGFKFDDAKAVKSLDALAKTSLRAYNDGAGSWWYPKRGDEA